MKVPFFRPSIDESDAARALACVRSGWLTTGPACAELEEALRAVTGAAHAVAMSSCTAALHCALAFRHLGPGDEVVVPSYTFVATASAVHHAGGVPVLADVRESDLNLGWPDVEVRLTSRTRGVVAVDFAGAPFDRAELAGECADRGLFLVADAAHSLGGDADGLPVGGDGLDTCVSFYANKNVTTGEGGAVLTADGALDSFARSFRLHGMSADAWSRYGGAWRPYDVAEFGWKYNLPDVLAALGVGQMRRLAETTARRAEIAGVYLDGFSNLPLRLPADSPGHAWHLFVIRTDRRDALMCHLREAGVATAVHYPPLHQMSVFAQADRDFPAAARAYETVLSLPLYPGLTREEQGYVVDRVKEFFT